MQTPIRGVSSNVIGEGMKWASPLLWLSILMYHATMSTLYTAYLTFDNLSLVSG